MGAPPCQADRCRRGGWPPWLQSRCKVGGGDLHRIGQFSIMGAAAPRFASRVRTAGLRLLALALLGFVVGVLAAAPGEAYSRATAAAAKAKTKAAPPPTGPVLAVLPLVVSLLLLPALLPEPAGLVLGTALGGGLLTVVYWQRVLPANVKAKLKRRLGGVGPDAVRDGSQA